MDIGFRTKKNNIIIILLVILLLAMSLVAFKYEDTLSSGRAVLNRAISFPIKTPVLQENVLVFFGFVGCSVICSTRLKEISDLSKGAAEKNPGIKLSVLFVNLDPTHTSDTANAYAQSYNRDFTGVTYSQKDLAQMVRLFRVNYSSGLSDVNEINHSQLLYFVRRDNRRQFVISEIYTHAPLNNSKILTSLVEKSI